MCDGIVVDRNGTFVFLHNERICRVCVRYIRLTTTHCVLFIGRDFEMHGEDLPAVV